MSNEQMQTKINELERKCNEAIEVITNLLNGSLSTERAKVWLLNEKAVPKLTLKRCPFCGDEAVDNSNERGIWVECQDCKASTMIFSSWFEAAQAWNKRVQ